MSKNFRATSFRIDAVEEQLGGRLKLKGHLTKAGVFEYQRGDERIRELRSEEEVFSTDSLRSLEGAFLTVDHPRVPPKDVAVGRVLSVESNPPYVTGVLQVEDARTAGMIKNGHLKEISCGYQMQLQRIDSEEADYSQTQIEYDHAALLPVGDGRLGRDVCLRLDSNGNEEVYMTDEANAPTDETQKVIDSLSKAVHELAEGQKKIVDLLTTTDSNDQSPIKKFEELPSEDQVEQIVNERVDSLLLLELAARDAHSAFFPKDYVEPVRCGKMLCERVLQTVDSYRTIDDSDNVEGLVKEASLLAKKHRMDRENEKTTVSKLRDSLGQGVPAAALNTPKSGLRARIEQNEN